jgi:2-polyprenyl-6-methoxyphenol hydroxylase-like FAD-dependent oxidoreductase
MINLGANAGASSLPIVVLGGGLAGLVTALVLSQKGFRVQVLEQAWVFKEIGAGIQLGPNVMRMFSILAILGITCGLRRALLIELKASQKAMEIGDMVRVATEQGQRYEAAAVVGADGLWSTVHEMFVKDAKPRVSGHIAYRAVMLVSDFPERLRWQAMAIWCGEQTHLVHLSLRGGEL